jgi:hypothetical protein
MDPKLSWNWKILIRGTEGGWTVSDRRDSTIYRVRLFKEDNLFSKKFILTSVSSEWSGAHKAE